jgi:hypothetical protein
VPETSVNDLPSTPSPRRWLKWGLRVIGALLVLVVGLFGWASVNTGTSLYARTIVWMQADTDDWKRFPSRAVAASPEPLEFEQGTLRAGDLNSVWVAEQGSNVDLDTFLGETGTTAFIVLQNDLILTERYFNGSSHDATQTSFSAAKSFVSTLVGIAIEEGHIGSLDDPVTAYIPELLDADPRMSEITIRNLVSMSSGLKYSEAGLPWTDDARTYYAPDLREAALSVEIGEAPGTTFLYNNYNPLLLGMVLERTTGMSVASYFETRLWQPMGAEAAGSWSLDSEASGFEKMESGINGRAIDFLRFGRLFLNEGRNGDQQVVSAQWVAEATSRDTSTDPAADYQYFWWIDEVGDGYLAWGNHGQFIYIVPSQELVVVRMGTGYGYDDWPAVLREIAGQLTE